MRNCGQSLFEVVFSVAIAAILVVGVVALTATSVRNSASARNDSLAKNYAEEAGEWLREERDKEWVSFKAKAESSASWCLKATPLSWNSPSKNSACSSSDFITSTIFIRNVTFSIINDNLIEATIIISWSDTQGDHNVTTVTRLANWRL